MRTQTPRIGRWLSGAAIVLLALVVLTAATGLLGVHSRQLSASGGGYTLTVTYAGVARPGLDVPLRVQVESDGPWGEDLTLRMSREYFTLFETQGFFPDADSSTGDPDWVTMTFRPPADGRAFVLDYDAYVQPATQLGTTGRIEVLDQDAPVVGVEFRTVLIP